MKGSYLAIMDWMLDLGLKSSELVAFAVVWSFSRDGESWFQGSATYVARWMGKSDRRTAMTALSSLVEKGLIEKRDKWENGVRLCDYRATEGCAKLVQGVQKLHGGSAKNVQGGSAKNVHHNKDIDNDTIVSKRDNRACARVGRHGERFQKVWERLTDQPGWKSKSAEALEECLNDLEAVPEEVAVEMMRNSLKNGWKGIFPLERGYADPEGESPTAAAARLEREALAKASLNFDLTRL